MKRQVSSCGKVARNASAYLDHQFSAEEQRLFEAHQRECEQCREAVEQSRLNVRRLRALPMQRPSEELATRLRVLASHEAARRRSRVSFSARFAMWRSNLQLFTDNLMRPLAIPTAGGLFSAIALFAMLAPGLTRSVSLHNDVPTGLYTEASVKGTVGVGFSNQEIIVEITVDEHGSMVDYEITPGQPLANSPEVRRAIANRLLFTRFEPARTFGQPMSGKILVSLRASAIDVKG
ncbi:MAG TPA: zf-HC2 domain-containing protein [Bryobacteraceae bacterium]|jgi:hypothetical protein|nr:zf-HC2 domain-containing protein [Bryobacteraceae bacterium]